MDSNSPPNTPAATDQDRRNVLLVLESALSEARAGRLGAVVVFGTNPDESSSAIAYADNGLTSGLMKAIALGAADFNVSMPDTNYDEQGRPFQTLEWRGGLLQQGHVLEEKLRAELAGWIRSEGKHAKSHPTAAGRRIHLERKTVAESILRFLDQNT